MLSRPRRSAPTPVAAPRGHAFSIRKSCRHPATPERVRRHSGQEGERHADAPNGSGAGRPSNNSVRIALRNVTHTLRSRAMRIRHTPGAIRIRSGRRLHFVASGTSRCSRRKDMDRPGLRLHPPRVAGRMGIGKLAHRLPRHSQDAEPDALGRICAALNPRNEITTGLDILPAAPTRTGRHRYALVAVRRWSSTWWRRKTRTGFGPGCRRTNLGALPGIGETLRRRPSSRPVAGAGGVLGAGAKSDRWSSASSPADSRARTGISDTLRPCCSNVRGPLPRHRLRTGSRSGVRRVELSQQFVHVPGRAGKAPHLDPSLRHGVPKMMLSAAQCAPFPFFTHALTV